MHSECDDVTVDVIILGVNHFLHSSFIQPGVRQECTSPKSAQGVDVIAMQCGDLGAEVALDPSRNNANNCQN